MGIKKVKIPDLVLEPTSSTELGLAGLLSLKRNKNSDEASEDLSFLESKSATVAFNKKTLFSVKDLIKDSVNSISLVPKDLKYDDSSIPEAPNFLEWCEGSEFLKATPYLEQALAGLLLYGEICPHCSDMEWVKDIDQHDPAHGTSAIRKHCAVLHQGRCYKCGRTRSEMIEAGEINFYNELILLWGQRCVTGDTHVLTKNGIERIGTIGRNKPYGFSTYQQPVFNGTEFETTSDFYRGRPERVHALTLRNGYVLRGTADHPVMTYRNFKRLANINTTDLVPVYVGQNVWGNKHIYHLDLVEQAKRSYELKLKSSKAPHLVMNAAFKVAHDAMTPEFYKMLGFWVAEGRGSFISNADPEVLDFCYRVLTSYINSRYIERQSNGIYIKGHTALAYLAAALGITNEETYSGSASKSIPESVLQSTKVNACAFLSGLFEGDGTVDTGKGKKKGRVSYTTISRSLAYDVYAVLTNLGILPSIRKRRTWATNGSDSQVSKNSWEVSFAGKHFLTLFQQHIGFVSNRKADRLDSIIQRLHAGKDMPYLFDNYSFLKNELRSVLNDARVELAEFRMPHTKFSNPSANRSLKSNRCMTLHTLLSGFESEFGYKLHKLFKEGRALTRTRLKYVTDCLLSGASYLSSTLVARIQRMSDLTSENTYLLEVKSCKLSKSVCETFDFTLPDTHQFITQGVLSHNSGKSEETAMLCTYQTHRILKMQNPARVYGIGDNQVLQGTFVALTQGQAAENLWTPFYGYLLGAPWFKKYHELMAMYDAKYNQELIKVRDTYVLYRHRNLLIYPAGPDKRILRGRTRVFAAIDELGWFDNGGVEASKKVKTSAKEVYTALSNSLQTVRAEERRLVASNMHTALTGYMYCISSPSSIRDKICELYKLSQGSKKMLGLHAPTWKINPKFTREVLDEEFRKDPVSAERDFGANPPLSSSPFIGDFSLVADARKEVGRNCVNYSHQTYTATDAKRSKTRFASIAGIKESGYPSVMAIDAGETNNSFSITTMSKHNGIHSIDCLIEIMPLPGIPLNYTLIFDKIILPIVKARNVRVIVSDRWNSTKILQDLYHTLTIDMYQKYSLKYADFWNFKTLLEQRAIKIPRSVILNSVEDLRAMDVSDYPRCFEGRPVEHFMFQIITVQDTGRQVVKGPDMTDDLWRAVVLGSWALDNLDFKDFLSEKAVKTVNRDPSRLAVSRGSSTGGSRISAGSSQVGKTGAVIKQRGGYNGY